MDDAGTVLRTSLAAHGFDVGPAVMSGVFADLGANGYVVVPRHLLDELLAAANGSVEAFRSRRMNTAAETLASALAAVVEAVGPTT
jgi:hypothetical protein